MYRVWLSCKQVVNKTKSSRAPGWWHVIWIRLSQSRSRWSCRAATRLIHYFSTCCVTWCVSTGWVMQMNFFLLLSMAAKLSNIHFCRNWKTIKRLFNRKWIDFQSVELSKRLKILTPSYEIIIFLNCNTFLKSFNQCSQSINRST